MKARSLIHWKLHFDKGERGNIKLKSEHPRSFRKKTKAGHLQLSFTFDPMITALSHRRMGLPRWCSDKESARQCRRHKGCGFDPWVEKIPWRRKWQPTPGILAWKILWTEEPGRLQPMGSDMTGHTHRQTDRQTHTHTHTHITEEYKRLPTLKHIPFSCHCLVYSCFKCYVRYFGLTISLIRAWHMVGK